MATWKFVISEPESRMSGQKEVDQTRINLLGKKIGDEFSGDYLEMTGYTLKITGGTDKDGFPMIPSVEGMGRRRVLLSGGPGFHPEIKGQRKRKTVRGNIISADIMQINCKVVKKGEKPFDQLFPKKEKPKEEKKEEEKKEDKKEDKPEEAKKEGKKPEPKAEDKKEGKEEKKEEETPAEVPEKEAEPPKEEPKKEKTEEVKNEEGSGGDGIQDKS